jgi:hypothetical protein
MNYRDNTGKAKCVWMPGLRIARITVSAGASLFFGMNLHIEKCGGDGNSYT